MAGAAGTVKTVPGFGGELFSSLARGVPHLGQDVFDTEGSATHSGYFWAVEHLGTSAALAALLAGQAQVVQLRANRHVGR